MAPRKEKVEKATADQGTAMVLDYLRKQNRPYSATDVSANLHNRVTKTQAAKVLKDLHDRKEIESRAAGKQIVYHSLQEPSTSTSAEDLAALESKMTDLREEIRKAKATEKALKSEVSTFSAVLSEDELRSTVEALEIQKSGLITRLEELRKVEVKPVSEKERVLAEEKRKFWTVHASARKKIVRALWLHCLYTMPEDTTTDEFWEQLGCEGPIPC